MERLEKKQSENWDTEQHSSFRKDVKESQMLHKEQT